MVSVKAYCSGCSRETKGRIPDYCEYCGSPQEYRIDYGEIAVDTVFDGRITDLWKYLPLYPLSHKPQGLSMGEGGTPLVVFSRIGAQLGGIRLWGKLDYLNPTASFKDRGVSVGMAHAINSDASAVICASSGNAAGAVAAYAARARIPATILIPATAPIPKVAVANAHGALVLRVDGGFSDAFRLARQAAQEMSWHNLTTTYVNGISVEGNKSVAYELFEQLGYAPDWVIVPVSAGPLLFGVWKGFTELADFGLIDRVPRLVAAQPEGCAPIARAFATGSSKVKEWSNVETIVSGLNDPLSGYEQDGTVTLRAVIASDGLALALSDEAILQAGRLLARAEGVFVEPAAAASIAGAIELRRCGCITTKENVVCLLTGHGLKQPALETQDEPQLISTLDEVRAGIATPRARLISVAKTGLHSK